MNTFRNIKNSPVLSRTIIAFTLLAVVFSTSRFFFISALRQSEQHYRQSSDYVFNRTETLLNLHIEYLEFRTLLNDTFLSDRFLALSDSQTKDRYASNLKSLNSHIVNLGENYLNTILTDTSLQEDTQNLHINSMSKLILLSENIMSTLNNNGYAAATPTHNYRNITDHLIEIESIIDLLSEEAIGLRTFSSNNFEDHLQRTTIIHNAISVLVGISLFGLLLYVVLSFNRMMQSYQSHAKKMVDGDFSFVPLEGKAKHDFENILQNISATFSGFITFINQIASENKERKDLSTLPLDGLTGAYRELAVSVNSLVQTIMEERFDNAFKNLVMDTMPIISTMSRRDATVLTVNNEGLRRFGFNTTEEYIARLQETSPEFQPDGTRSMKKRADLIKEAFRYGHSSFEWVHINSKGEELPSFVHLFVVPYKDDEVLLSFITDLRQIKEIEKKEAQVQKHMDFLLQSSPLLIEHWNELGELTLSNTHTFNHLGFASEQDYIKNRKSLLPVLQENGKLSVDYWNSNIQQLFASDSNDPLKWEYHYTTKDGTPIYFSVEGYKVNYEGSDIVVTYSTDITDVKRAMETAFEEKQKVQQATENSYAKSAFLAKMSHEIRTPISAVMGISEIQIGKPSNTLETEEAFVKIHASADLLLSIVNDILDLSKIESGKMPLANDPYETAGFIQTIAQINSFHLGSRNLDFHVSINPKLPSVLVGDEGRIKQIVINILSNAFKYTDVGYVRLSVEFEEKFDETTQDDDFEIDLIIKVEDTGRGMSNEQVDILFDEYTRFHDGEDKLTQGTGLGMFVTKNFLDLMNGHIKVTSRVAVGTQVLLHIPQKVSNPLPIGGELARSLESFKTNTLNTVAKLNVDVTPMPYGSVLVVDDVDANLYVAKGLMNKYELRIDTAKCGTEAVNKIKDGNVYDIIFMDQVMPDISGQEATQIIRSMGYTHPIIAFTANAIVGKADEYLEQGFDGFISKPIQTTYLNAILNKFIKDKYNQ